MAESVAGDEVLVERALWGDERAFDGLMRRHADAVRSLIAHYFRDRTQVDDLAQETFVKAYFALRQYRGAAPFIFWIKQIAVRLCIDEMRRRKSQREVVESLGRATRMKESSTGAGAEDRMNARLLVNELLATLHPLDRMILVLLDGEGHSVAEVAQLTGLTRANVKVRAFRIRRHLRNFHTPEVVSEERSSGSSE